MKTILEFSLVFFRIYWCFCTISAWKTIQNTPCLKEKKERSILPITRLALMCHPGLWILKYIFRSPTLAKCVILVPNYHDPPGSYVALTWNATWALSHFLYLFFSLFFISHSILFVWKIKTYQKKVGEPRGEERNEKKILDRNVHVACHSSVHVACHSSVHMACHKSSIDCSFCSSLAMQHLWNWQC